MTTIIEEKELVIRGDAWWDITRIGGLPTKEQEHQDLEELTARFLARGGAIDHVHPGASAEIPVAFNTVDAAHTRAQRTGRKNTIQKGDEKMVAIIEQHLGVCARMELLEILKCSDSKFQRLLNVYFHDDGRADPLRTVPHEDYHAVNEGRWVTEIECLQAAGMTGRQRIADAVGISYNTLLKLIKKGVVNIPKCHR